MKGLLCPLCGAGLTRQERVLRCPAGHCFDLARQGYVNLLPVNQKHSLHPGDTKEQVAARRSFLEGGYYAPIAEAVCDALGEPASILDVGCGEGYYTARAAAKNPDAEVWALDISKDAVRLGAGKYKNIRFLCGTAAHLPFAEGSFEAIMSLFALTVPEEFRRVLIPGGTFVQVLAAEDHLLGLKEIIYPELLHRQKDSVPELPGFRLVSSRALRVPIRVEGEQIGNLLSMTPHFWRITKEGAARLAQTQSLSDEASVVINRFEAL